MARLRVIALSALTVGCVTPYWIAADGSAIRAEDGSAIELETAIRRCQLALSTSSDPKYRSASTAGRSQVIIGGLDDSGAYDRQFRKCMHEFGYRRVMISDEEYEALLRAREQADTEPGGEPARSEQD